MRMLDQKISCMSLNKCVMWGFFERGTPKQTGLVLAVRRYKYKITEMHLNEKMKMLLLYTLLKTPQAIETQWSNTVSEKFRSV